MQTLLIATIFALGLAAFASGRIRHDLVALLMLGMAVALGLVAPMDAFSGFGDPVVVTVAGVMVLSAAIARSGLLRVALQPFRSALVSEIGIAAVFACLCATASAFMNNVGALALLLPAALAACRAASVSASRVLMPMAFASLLGGLVTVIGTPPNVIISRLRTEYAGGPFEMFDFAPVGFGLALAGVILLLLTIRLLPVRLPAGGEPLLFRVADYLFEARVSDKAREKPLTIGDLRTAAKGEDSIAVHAIDRDGIIFTAPGDWRPLRPGDVVQLEGRAPVIQSLLEREGLELVGGAENDALEAALFESVVSYRSPLVGASNVSDQLAQASVALLAVSRRDRAIVDRLERISLLPGDVVLLQAQEGRKHDIVEKFALLPLAERTLELGAGKLDWRPALALGGAILAATFAVAPLAVALIAAIIALALMGRVNHTAYGDIDWSILVLLAAIIPVSEAFTALGAGDTIAIWLTGLGEGLPRLLVIGLVLAVTMAATPFLNNAAAVLIMAPIAAQVGQATGAGIDAMLMAVAVGASSDFLTPIGHQSNTLVMGPGGYRFFDYARLGAPLSVLVLVLGAVLIEQVW